MKVVIAGAGKIGTFLARELKEKDIKVVLIENDSEVCEKISDKLNIETVCSDAADYGTLSRVCEGARTFVAVTGKDEVNLIACQIAKKSLEVPVTIARINNPHNNEVAPLFGVDKFFCGTSVFVDLVENEIELEGLRVVVRIENSDHVIVQFELSPKSKACGQKLMDFKFIKDSKVVVITSEEKGTFTPNGETVMNAGDNMLMVCHKDNVEAVWKAMVCG